MLLIYININGKWDQFYILVIYLKVTWKIGANFIWLYNWGSEEKPYYIIKLKW